MQIKNNYLLSNLTTLSIGGPAREFVEVTTEAELTQAIAYAKKQGLEYLVIGGGSNLLVSDDGVDKLVIKNNVIGISSVIPSDNEESQDSKSGDPSLVAQDDKIIVSVKSGTTLQDLVDFATLHGLDGLQRLAGIPGTVGGAIYGNAGAYGQSISDHLISVVVLDPPSVIARVDTSTRSNLDSNTNQDSHPKGTSHFVEAHAPAGLGMTMTKEACAFNYRDSIFKKNNSIILEAKFALKTGDKTQMEQEAKDTIEQRLKKYPPGIKCPGSFFKNIIASSLSPEILAKIPQEKIVYGKLPAGVLLEEVGAKGDTLGDIEIAPYHANLFINRGGGTAKDFYALAKKYADLVKEKYEITLEPEVQLIGLPDILGAYR